MVNLSLDGKWMLYPIPMEMNGIDSPEKLEKSGIEPIEGEVPGNVELDLSRAGLLPEDLFFGTNIYSVRKYEVYDFWYKKEFDWDPGWEDRLKLVVKGADTICEYWINGILTGRSQNMLIPFEFPLAEGLIKDKKNVIYIRISSAYNHAKKYDYDGSIHSLITNRESLHIRKAPHSYGWDIMPRALSAGLYRSISIEKIKDSYIEEIYVYTRNLDRGPDRPGKTINRGDKAKLAIRYRIRTTLDTSLSSLEDINDLVLKVTGVCKDSGFTLSMPVHFDAGMGEVDIKDPWLWWPKGYGDANLYNLVAELVYKGDVLDVKKLKTGIRTRELVFNDGSGGGRRQFLFKINGVPILFKGANWVPADVFHSRDNSRYHKMLELFKGQECNIVRCWGGNVYEDDKFFDLCDEYGIMVWQDFSFACAVYPHTRELFDLVREEVASVAKRIRNHPSLLIWCGDNECDMAYYNWNGYNPENNVLTREVIARAIFNHDPHTPYIPSSPYYTEALFKSKQLELTPEQHLWGPRDYYKSGFYTGSKAVFVSEIGYHGCVGLDSIKKFIDGDKIWPIHDNDQWKAHSTDALGRYGSYNHRIELMANQTGEMFGKVPDNIEDFILASQISQGEAKKFFVELTRIKKWDRTGIIWWNMIDGWPQFSDAVVDYYFTKKLAWHYIKRVQGPLAIMFDEPEDWHCRVIAGNDSNFDFNVSYEIFDIDTQNIILKGEFISRTNENEILGRVPISHGLQRFYVIKWEIDSNIYFNHYLLGKPPFSLEKYKDWLFKYNNITGEEFKC